MSRQRPACVRVGTARACATPHRQYRTSNHHTEGTAAVRAASSLPGMRRRAAAAGEEERERGIAGERKSSCCHALQRKCARAARCKCTQKWKCVRALCGSREAEARVAVAGNAAGRQVESARAAAERRGRREAMAACARAFPMSS